jgi:hypothetical protein
MKPYKKPGRKRRPKIQARGPKPLVQAPMKPIKECDCGKPGRRGVFHTAVGCWEEE